MISERDEAKRARVRAQVRPLASDRFISVDEISTHIAMTRRYTRAPHGERAYGRVPRNHGPNLSRSGALSLRGMVATMSVEGAVDTKTFAAFVEQGLVPALPPGDLVLRANRKVCWVSNIQQAVSTSTNNKSEVTEGRNRAATFFIFLLPAVYFFRRLCVGGYLGAVHLTQYFFGSALTERFQFLQHSFCLFKSHHPGMFKR